MSDFTPLPALAGGALIGLASASLLLLNGRIAGISGIAGALFRPAAGEVRWRLFFLGGLLAGGAVMAFLQPQDFPMALARSPASLIAAGLLVGFGTRLGNGCTSGHGVCGIGRGAPRSIVATLSFMATGAATVWVVARFFGGAL